MSTTAQPPARTQMASEIAEQPAAARRTLDHLLPQRERLRALFEGRRRVLLVARGSSDNAAIYGRRILTWMESTTFEVIIGVLIALAIIGTVVSGVAVYRSTRRPGSSHQSPVSSSR